MYYGEAPRREAFGERCFGGALRCDGDRARGMFGPSCLASHRKKSPRRIHKTTGEKIAISKGETPKAEKAAISRPDAPKDVIVTSYDKHRSYKSHAIRHPLSTVGRPASAIKREKMLKKEMEAAKLKRENAVMAKPKLNLTGAKAVMQRPKQKKLEKGAAAEAPMPAPVEPPKSPPRKPGTVNLAAPSLAKFAAAKEEQESPLRESSSGGPSSQGSPQPVSPGSPGSPGAPPPTGSAASPLNGGSTQVANGVALSHRRAPTSAKRRARPPMIPVREREERPRSLTPGEMELQKRDERATRTN